MTGVRSRIAKLVQKVGYQVEMLMSESTHYKDLKVYADEYPLSDFSELWFEKVRRAVDLIDATSPVTATRLFRHVHGILISSTHGHDYLESVKIIRLLGPSIITREVPEVALIIVHEVAHARIAARGIPYAKNQRERHETVCTRAEARFALKLPDGADRVPKIMSKLARPWWTDEALRARQLAELDRIDMPVRVREFLKHRIMNSVEEHEPI